MFWLVAPCGSTWIVFDMLIPQLSSSSSLLICPWCSFTSASICSNQSKQQFGLVPSNLGIFSKALLILLLCWFSHFSVHFLSSFLCFFLLSFFSFLPFVFQLHYIPSPVFFVIPIAFVKPIRLMSQYFVLMDC